MKRLICLIALALCFTLNVAAQGKPAEEKKSKKEQQMEQQVFNLSHQKWEWMSQKDADNLAQLFHDNSVFVHMGGAWGKEQEVNIIRSGMIHYKKATIRKESIRFVDDTAVILCDMDLLAVVGGHEVTNHFMVTEVFVKEGKAWKLASLSFTKLMR